MERKFVAGMNKRGEQLITKKGSISRQTIRNQDLTV